MVEFIKAQGLGNDFIICVDQNIKPDNYSAFSHSYSNRRYGIGCDQVIFATSDSQKTYSLRFFNPDGSEAEACGNGTRCAAKYLMQKNHLKKIILTSTAGKLACELLDNDFVRVQMPSPVLKLLESNESLGHLSQPNAVSVTIGNPHLVCFVNDTSLVTTYGEGLENHPAFELRTNVDFAKIISDSEIELRVWERGTGPTPACGSGASATAVAAYYHGLCKNKVSVKQEGGELIIEHIDDNVYMSGPAEIVFEGKLLNTL